MMTDSCMHTNTASLLLFFRFCPSLCLYLCLYLSLSLSSFLAGPLPQTTSLSSLPLSLFFLLAVVVLQHGQHIGRKRNGTKIYVTFGVAN